MKSFGLFIACILGVALTACAASNPVSSVTPDSANQISTRPGWISPDANKTKNLLYVSDTGKGIIDIFSLPKYSLVGQITKGIHEPEGIATDKHGNLYVANLLGNTITVYKPGKTSPSLTLTESHGPIAVAVASNGNVYAGDLAGGIDIYSPGARSPRQRRTKPDLVYGVAGVSVDALHNVYAAGAGPKGAVVVEFYHGSGGSGTDLHLSGLGFPSGVLIDSHANIVVSDASGAIRIYPQGQRSPSSTITVSNPERSAINALEDKLFVPESSNNEVGVYTYPGGKSVATIPIGAFTGGAALIPAPKP